MPGMNLTRQEAEERAAVITRIESYKISLDLTQDEKIFPVRAEITFAAKAGRSTFIDAITSKVRSIELNGEPVDTSAADGVRIQLPALAEKNILVIDADFMYTNTGEGLHRFVDPVDQEVYLYSQFEVPDSRRVFPVFEQPDLKAEFEFVVTAPAHWQVISNQPELAIDESETKKTWHFKPTPRISSYITAIIAGPYDKVTSSLTNFAGREIALGVFARKSLMPYLDSEEIFTITAQGFEFYEEQFKTEYPFEKYDQLFVPEFNAGAMENAGAVTFLENYIFRSKTTEAMIERRAVTILHELAHMWFGDLVTMKWWNDLWLNESFAEFMSTLATAENTRFASQAWATFSASEKTWAYRQDQLSSTHPIVAPIRDLDDVQVNFDGITYAKGASVLRQMVAWVGQENFMAALTEYFRKHAFGNTVLDDLLVELESASGRDVKTWSKKWLETAGVNTLTTEVEESNGVISSLSIRQSFAQGFETLRPHRLVVGFYNQQGGKLTRTERFELDVDGEITEVIEAAGLKRPDLILVNDEDLAYAKIRLDEKSRETAIAHLGEIDSPVARGVVWGSLWDATRDAQMPARSFVELVLNNIGQETNSTAVRTQLLNLELTLRSYVAKDAAEQTRLRAGQRMWEIAQSAEADSDNQLQFVRSFARLAETAEQLDIVEALLSGEKELEGLEIDTDLRWALVTSLAAGGRRTAADIDAELERDNTSNGQQAAATAQAAIPTSAAKEKVWNEVVENNELSNIVQRSAIAGFFAPHDNALTDPFIDRYFNSIEGLWRERSHEISQQIIGGLFPRNYSKELVEKTEKFLESLPDDAASLHRQVSEARDGMVRALKVQAADQ